MHACSTQRTLSQRSLQDGTDWKTETEIVPSQPDTTGDGRPERSVSCLAVVSCHVVRVVVRMEEDPIFPLNNPVEMDQRQPVQQPAGDHCLRCSAHLASAGVMFSSPRSRKGENLRERK